MKEYSVNNLKLLVNGECINLGCFVGLVKNKPINMEKYIASYKHLIGCEYKSKYNDLVRFCSETTAIDVLEEPWRLSSALFWIDGETLGTYEEYMQLHYPEYERVWKHQL